MSKSRLTPEEKRWIKIMEPTTIVWSMHKHKPIVDFAVNLCFSSDSPDYNFERTNQSMFNVIKHICTSKDSNKCNSNKTRGLIIGNKRPRVIGDSMLKMEPKNSQSLA